MRLIDSDALNEEFGKYLMPFSYHSLISKVINAFPTVEERKHGRWLDHPNKELKEWMVCSSCGVGCKLIEHLDDSIEIQMYVFCPHCGADMRGE